MCFGAQALAQALGGRVGRNPDGGFVLKVEEMQLMEPLRSSAALRLAQADVAAAGGDGSSNSSSNGSAAAGASPARVRLIQSHGDQVLELPPGAVVLAQSSTAPYEMWSAAGGNVLAVQVR